MSLHLEILKRERWNNSATPTIKRLLSGQLLDGTRWSYNRIGGCNTLDARFKYYDEDHPEDPGWADPKSEDWEASDWFGGEVHVRFRWLAGQETGWANTTEPTIWLGRLTRIRYDTDTRIVQVQAEGLVRNLDEIHVTWTWDQKTIREVLTDIGRMIVRSHPADKIDSYIRGTDIVARGALMDVKIDLEAKWESARSVIQKVFEFLPQGMVWGVDRAGNFYVQQQGDHYGSNASKNQMAVLVDDEATRWQRDVQLSEVRTVVQVLGKENDDETDRITAEAFCEKARDLYGLRREIYTDTLIADIGLAQKIAAQRCSKKSSIGIAGKLTTVKMHSGRKDLWQSLNNTAPAVAVSDRSKAEDLAGWDEAFSPQEYGLRYYGDIPGYSASDLGSAGAAMSVASNSAEQAMDTNWLVHIALRFDYAHPGSSGDLAFLFGRPRDSATLYGWGELWWANDATGTLYWQCRDGTTNRQLDTGIDVNPSSPGNTEVHLTIYRDGDGDVHFLNGTSHITRSTAVTGTLNNTTDPWRFWDAAKTVYGSGEVDGDVSINDWWVVSTGTIENLLTVHATPPSTMGGAIYQWIVRNHNRALRRDDGLGVRRYCRFNYPTESSATPSFPCVSATSDDADDWSATSVSYTQSLATGSQNGTVVTDGSVIGQQVGQDKKWGGPLILNAENVSYSIDGEGLVTREMQLGHIPVDGYTTIARLREEVKRQDEYLRRTIQDL